MKLDQLIDQHIKAIGGREAIEGVHSLQVEFHLVEPTFEVDGIYRAERRGRMRVDILANDVRVFTEGYDGSQGWQWKQDDEHGAPASSAGSQALVRGIERQLMGLHELGSRGHRLELSGRELVKGVDYYVIQWMHRDGFPSWCYIHPETWLLERTRERKALHVDVDPTETVIETNFTDFRPVDGGLVRPFHETQTDLATGQLLQTTIVKQLLVNPIFESGLFDCP